MNVRGLVIVLAGVFTIFCAAMNFNWFMEHRKARYIVKYVGRNGARVFYGVLGLMLVSMGALLLLGVKE